MSALRPPTLPLGSARPLLLGSASPRRRQMLTELGVPVVAVAPDVDETVHEGEEAEAYLARVTRAKAARAAELGASLAGPAPGALLVADTVVVLDGRIVDKPRTQAEARGALEALSGRAHDVVTCFVVADGAGQPLATRFVSTRVVMRALGAGEMDRYAASGEGLDKAGGYGIQGGAASFVTRLEGSYTNVVGLPLAEVVLALAELALWQPGA